MARFPRPLDPALQQSRIATRIDNRERSQKATADPRPSVRVPTPGGAGGPHPADYVVAASNSDSQAKAGADLVCTGSGDATAIQPLMDAAWGKDWSGSVLLLPGTYNWDTDFLVRSGCSFLGCGGATHLDGAGGSLVLSSGALAASLAFWPYGAAAAAIRPSVGAADVTVADVRLYSQDAGAGIETGALWRVLGCHLSDFGLDGVSLIGDHALVSGCSFNGSGVHFTGSANEVTGCVFETDDQFIYMAGADDLMAGCVISASGSPNNTIDAVRIAGTQESFTNNRLRADGGSSARCRYGVNILAAASGARVKYNDLRPAPSRAWGTAALLDSGTGSLVADND